MQRVIFFSGMGADHRAFQYLKLSNVETHYINWIEPENDEPLETYAMRLVHDFEFKTDDVFIGLSLGGLIAQEIAAKKAVKKVILISSLRSGETLQPLFSAAQKLHLLQVFNANFLKSSIINGAKILFQNKSARLKTMVEMVDQFSGNYYKWAMNEVLHWNGANAQCPVLHVHGDKDQVFPVNLVKDAEIIPGGTHLMVVEKAEEVSAVLQKFLNQKTL